MADPALNREVGACQGEPGGAVIEFGSLPLHGRVAGRASLSEAGAGMIGVGGFVEVIHVAGSTSLGGSRIFVVAVAFLAAGSRMGSRQGESTYRMIELRAAPFDRLMARGAVHREPAADVIGIFGARVIVQVTSLAILGGSGKPA